MSLRGAARFNSAPGAERSGAGELTRVISPTASLVDQGKNPHLHTKNFVERLAGENMYTNGILSGISVSRCRPLHLLLKPFEPCEPTEGNADAAELCCEVNRITATCCAPSSATPSRSSPRTSNSCRPLKPMIRRPRQRQRNRPCRTAKPRWRSRTELEVRCSLTKIEGKYPARFALSVGPDVLTEADSSLSGLADPSTPDSGLGQLILQHAPWRPGQHGGVGVYRVGTRDALESIEPTIRGKPPCAPVAGVRTTSR